MTEADAMHGIEPTPDDELVLLGLGANVGDPEAQLARAVEMLGAVMRVEAVSSLYRTEPVGYREQADFLNLVVAGWTELDPAALLEAVRRIEAAMGRERPFPDAPRTLDIDILAYGRRVIATPALVVPHPRLHLRGFVLHPLAETAPEWRHPAVGKTARELLSTAPSGERVERVGRLPGHGGALAPRRPPG
jgi:2-amino-4-hydroxy-6-hydroxymethyldihydropteridine diphosphokinase